jgi:hypothetical protein
MFELDKPAIEAAFDVAYRQVGQDFRRPFETMHTQPLCTSVSEVALAQLAFRHPGFRGGELETREASDGQWHDYLRLPRDLLADGTWQQFLPEEKRLPDLPKVAIGRREEVVGIVREAGVPAIYHQVFWRK